MKYKYSKIFSNGTEYEIFKDNYCNNNCRYHKEDENGLPCPAEKGGCPIEDKMEYARFDKHEFPNVLIEEWNDAETMCFSWHICPFFTKEKGDINENRYRY